MGSDFDLTGRGGADHDDLLWRHLKTAPAFRALLRAVEARFCHYLQQSGDIVAPILDLGCGDGHFASLALNEPPAAGVDPWWGPLNKARRTAAHRLVVQGVGSHLPFPDGAFATVVSNSVLEHIANVQPVLNEAARVLRPGGRLVVTMPSHHFTEFLGGAERLDPVGLADHYRRFFNRISRHAHTDPPEHWAARLAQAGLAIDRWQYYFSRPALRALEWGHVQGLPSAVLHFLTGHWVVAPWPANLRGAERWLRPFYDEPNAAAGAYLLFVTQKRRSGPIPAVLPAARPLDLAGWEPDGTQAAPPPGPADEWPVAPLEDPIPAVEAPVAMMKPAPAAPRPAAISANVVSGLLMVLALLTAAIGQLALSAEGARPTAGLRWFGVSFVAMLLLAGRRRGQRRPAIRWPRLQEMAPRRLFIVPALLLAALAPRPVSGPSPSTAAVALFVWLVAMGLALYALWDEAPGRAAGRPLARWEIGAAAGLFVVALGVRLFDLTSHPFILSGAEASLGLDAWAAATGRLANPFSTGWLTNPTLPLFLMGAPLKLLGRTVLAVRFLSPFVGALTVPLIFLAGRRLYGPAVGLVAAILLAGAHVHLHFSRVGLTNIWDPLLTLAALSLSYAAWQRGSRPAWLAAGLVTGLNAYFYTASHLLPLILAGLLVYWLVADGRGLWQQRGHLLAAGLLALVVAWPQYTHYRNSPGVFMDRANSLGIFQSGWLVREAAATGRTAQAILVEQVWKGLLAFNFGQDTSLAYNAGSTLLRFGPAVLLALGMGLALARWRQLRFGLLLVWYLVSVLFAGALMESPPASHRLLIVLPAALLLAALALAWLGQKLWRLLELDNRQLMPALAAVAIVAIAGDLLFYFGRYRSEPRYGDRNTEIAQAMAGYLNGLDAGWTAYFHGPPFMYISFPTLPYLAGDFAPNVNLFDVGEDGQFPVPPAGKVAFLILPERAAELAAVEQQYPGGEVRFISGEYADPLFIVYEWAATAMPP